MGKKPTLILLVIILIVGAIFRFYQIDTLPGEIFGDISENLNHINSVLNGEWKLIYGYDGREGLLFYLAGLMTHFFGNTYLSLKVTVAIIGWLTIITVYKMAESLEGRNIALITAALLAVSKWSVVFSRIGFRVVFVPLFISLIIFAYLQAIKTKKWKYFFLLGIILGLGMYTYPAFKFCIPVIFTVSVVDLWKNNNLRKKFLLAWGIFFLLFIPMAIDFQANKIQYTDHTRQMFLTKNGTVRNDWVNILEKNVVNQSRMFNVKGDIVFRVNPSNQAMLDSISGIFFLIGMAYWLFFYRSKNKWLILSLFLVMQLPSILVINNPIDIPSATRSLGIIPIVYFLTALGIYKSVAIFKKYSFIVLLIILVIIAVANWYNYFGDYAYGLPNHNIAYDREIANLAQNTPNDIKVVMVGCCWADWGGPEQKGVQWWLDDKTKIKYIDGRNNDLKYLGMNSQKSLLILSPNWKNQLKGFSIESIFDNYGRVMFQVAKNY